MGISFVKPLGQNFSLRYSEAYLVDPTRHTEEALMSVATNPNFVDGAAVVVEPLGGVMVEAAMGGQQFTYQGK